MTSVIIDVRSPEEYAERHVEGAINIPHDIIANNIASFVDDQTFVIKLYCRSGHRAGIAKQALESMGYNAVENLGGIDSLI